MNINNMGDENIHRMFKIGDVVIYNNDRYIITQYMGELFEMVDGQNDMLMHNKYKIHPVNGGDDVEVLEGQIEKAQNNINDEGNVIMYGGRRSLRNRNRKRSRKTYRKKAKKSKRSRRH